MIKLIATDMDGTWLNAKKEYDVDKFREIMRLCKEKDILFVVASGNQYENLLTRFPKEYIPRMHFVAENGAYVVKGHERLRISDLNDEEIATLQEIEKEYPVFRVWAGVSSAYTLSSFNPNYVKELNKFFAKMTVVDDFSEIKNDRLFKLTLSTKPGDAPELARELRQKYPNLDMVAGSDSGVDMSKKGMNKSVGLKFLGQRYGIKPSEMVSFGDSGNDVAMMEYTGMSFATATALPEAKRAAKRIIGSSEDSSVQNKMLDLLKA